MQKVIKRSILAERQAARRLTVRKERLDREWRKSNREQIGYSNREKNADIKAGKLSRREDYELGPLAPKRDVGELKEKYGTINSQRARGNDYSKEELKEVLKPVGGEFLHIVAGDRVVLLEGRDKGKIGVIREIDKKRAECYVKGLNMVDVSIPEWMISSNDQDKRPIRTIEKPVPLTTVRLVYPLTDEETGQTRDVIIKKLTNSPIWFDKRTGGAKYSRIIPGLNIKIPWPKQDPPQHEDYPVDTLRIDVETKTYVPTLLRPPMPSTVIDELRNKYSAFRTRHDPEYIEKKVAEDREKEDTKKLAKQMRTPLQEINRKERKLRKMKGKGKLTDEMLERIGRVIAEKRELVPGVSREGSAPEPVKLEA